MFGLGTTELIVILAVVVLLFGATRLPQLGQGIGQAIKNFKKGVKDSAEADVTSEATKGRIDKEGA